jgi:hypothetical protein
MERNVIEAIEIVVQQPELEKVTFFFCFVLKKNFARVFQVFDSQVFCVLQEEV